MTVESSVSSTLAASRYETHARHKLVDGPPYSLDSALHMSRYVWVIEQLVCPGDTVVDLGCGTGFAMGMLAAKCDHVVGVDLDPAVVGLAEKLGLTNASFYRDDVCSTGLTERLDIHNVDVVISMETIEHLEDYFSYIENAMKMMKSGGVFVVGTPNRRMTYERYAGRRHMDPSHIQEFTPIALARILGVFFGSVEIYYQCISGYWGTNPTRPSKDAVSRSALSRWTEGWIPPKIVTQGRRVRSRLQRMFSGVTPRNQGYDLSCVEFLRAQDGPTVTLDAFAILAICKLPK